MGTFCCFPGEDGVYLPLPGTDKERTPFPERHRTGVWDYGVRRYPEVLGKPDVADPTFHRGFDRAEKEHQACGNDAECYGRRAHGFPGRSPTSVPPAGHSSHPHHTLDCASTGLLHPLHSEYLRSFLLPALPCPLLDVVVLVYEGDDQLVHMHGVWGWHVGGINEIEDQLP